MPGPPPKDPEKRRRRNKDSAGSFDEVPSAGYAGEFPPLPKTWRREYVEWERDPETREKYAVNRVEEVEFLAATGEWYETFARSPIACRFTSTDWRRLLDIAPLKDQFYRGNHSLAGEFRLQESLLGATVKDRQAMRVRVVDAPASEEKGKPAEVRRLRAV